MNSNINPINKRIAVYRSFAGYTQQAAAEKLGLKKNTYARMERYGNPTPDMLKKLAALYNVSVNTLLFGTDETEGENRTPSATGAVSQEKQIILSVNEQNCVKMCRNLPESMQQMVASFINNLYQEFRNKNQ